MDTPDSTNQDDMIISVVEGALTWKDISGTEHKVESLYAAMWLGANTVRILRRGQLLSTGHFGHAGTHGSYDCWAGMKEVIGSAYAISIHHSNLQPGDEIHILTVPIHEQANLWREMQTSH